MFIELVGMDKELLIPDDVKLEIQGKKMVVSGKNGLLEKELKLFHDIKIEVSNNKLLVHTDSDAKPLKAMVGTIISHAKNLIKGVREGYTYKMRIVYTHFPITVKVEGNNLIISNFLGEKTSRIAKILGNTKVQLHGQDIVLTGPNKEDVAQTAANIETATKISKKDRRVFQDGIYIVKKRE